MALVTPRLMNPHWDYHRPKLVRQSSVEICCCHRPCATRKVILIKFYNCPVFGWAFIRRPFVVRIDWDFIKIEFANSSLRREVFVTLILFVLQRWALSHNGEPPFRIFNSRDNNVSARSDQLEVFVRAAIRQTASASHVKLPLNKWNGSLVAFQQRNQSLLEIIRLLSFSGVNDNNTRIAVAGFVPGDDDADVSPCEFCSLGCRQLGKISLWNHQELLCGLTH